jgi:hypothetical protein
MAASHSLSLLFALQLQGLCASAVAVHFQPLQGRGDLLHLLLTSLMGLQQCRP